MGELRGLGGKRGGAREGVVLGEGVKMESVQGKKFVKRRRRRRRMEARDIPFRLSGYLAILLPYS